MEKIASQVSFCTFSPLKKREEKSKPEVVIQCFPRFPDDKSRLRHLLNIQMNNPLALEILTQEMYTGALGSDFLGCLFCFTIRAGVIFIFREIRGTPRSL